MENKIISIQEEVKKAIVGKDEIIRRVMAVIIAGGHILLEDIPGVGKTTLALAFSKAMDLKFNRIQFTPDVVPSDITGFTVYNRQTGAFEYKEGAAMCNVLLADEINRTSSKTQSALLEVMQEGRITVDGQPHAVPEPFLVIATQNPIGTAGTQMLPEAQLDRFMVQLSIGYPDEEAQVNILKDRQVSDPLKRVCPAAERVDILALRKVCREVFVHDKIYRYISRLCSETREHPLIRLGVSPRGALAMCGLAQSWALMHGRGYVIPGDVQDIFFDVCRHRIILNGKAQLQNKNEFRILQEVMGALQPPKAAEWI